MLFHAEVYEDDGIPVLVKVAGRSASVPHFPEAPAAAVRIALGRLGYEPRGAFTRSGDRVSVVDVQITAAAFAAKCAAVAR